MVYVTFNYASTLYNYIFFCKVTKTESFFYFQNICFIKQVSNLKHLYLIHSEASNISRFSLHKQYIGILVSSQFRRTLLQEYSQNFIILIVLTFVLKQYIQRNTIISFFVLIDFQKLMHLGQTRTRYLNFNDT